MFKSFKAWWYRRYSEPFTVACDRAPFNSAWTDREELFHVIGLATARSLGYKWVRKHTHGAARFIPGHHYWDNAAADKARCEGGKCADPSFHTEENQW
jgi:hypothetical protein